MKVLVVIPALGSVYGGPSKCVLELVHALSDRSIQVDLVTTNANGPETLDVPLQTWLAAKSYRIQYFPCWYAGDYKLSPPLTQWLFAHVTDYDLVHTNAIFSYPVLPAHWACRFHHVPYIMTPHGMLDPWALAYKANKKRVYFSLFERPALNYASALQVLTSIEAKCVELLGLRSPVRIVPNGIHRHDFVNLPSPELFYQAFPQTRHKTLILFLGRIDPKKGLDLLAKAFARVHTHHPDTHLIIAGPDSIGFLPTVKQYFAAADVLKAVTFTGMLSGDIKYAALAAADLYVAPSYSEGFSISVLEGMASGLPCIITTACNFPEAAAAEAALVVEIEAEAIANALLYCLRQPQDARIMGDRARQLIFDRYTWDRIAAQMQQVYAEVLDRPFVSTGDRLLPR